MDKEIQVKQEFDFVDVISYSDTDSIYRVLPVKQKINAIAQDSDFEGDIKIEIKGSQKSNFCSKNETELFLEDPVSAVKNEPFIFNKDYETHTGTEYEEETIVPDFCSPNEGGCFSKKLDKCSELDIKMEIKEEQQCPENNSTESMCIFDQVEDGINGNISSAESPRLCSDAGDDNDDSPLVPGENSMKNSSLSYENNCYEFKGQETNVTRTPTLEKDFHSEYCGTYNVKINSTVLFFHNTEKSQISNISEKSLTRSSYLQTASSLKKGKKLHKCEVCQKSFTRLSDLKLHNLIHEGKKPHKCQICEKKFTQLAHLKSHNFIHEGIKPHKCQICEKSFARLSNLKSHSLIHEGRKPHKCKICEKSFTRLSDLKSHSSIHEGKKPYKCEICEKRFTRLSYLKSHNLIHENKRPHKCHICEKTFICLSHLKWHNLLHNDKKPHKCALCEKRFFRLSDLKRHNLIHRVNKA